MQLIFVRNGPAVPPAIYSEPRFHESFVTNSQQAILETSAGKDSRFSNTQPVNTYRYIVRGVKLDVQENIFVVSFHYFSALVSKLNKGIKRNDMKIKQSNVLIMKYNNIHV